MIVDLMGASLINLSGIIRIIRYNLPVHAAQTRTMNLSKQNVTLYRVRHKVM